MTEHLRQAAGSARAILPCMRLLRRCAALFLILLLWQEGVFGQAALPSPPPQAAAARAEELCREARELYHAALLIRRRQSPERITLLQRALSVLSRALELDEHNAELRMLLGSWLTHTELGEAALKQSVVELLRARKDDVSGALNGEIASLLGIVYSHRERFADAVAEYDLALRLLPGQPDLASAPRRQQQSMMLGNSAEALMALGRLDAAILRYAQAEAIDGSDQAALHALGLAVAYDRDGQLQKSREALERSLAADPGLRTFQSEDVFFVPAGDRHYYWGLLHEIFGNRDEAIRAFRDFLNEVPRSRYADRARSHIEQMQRQPGYALSELLRARVIVGIPQFPSDVQSGTATRRHRTEAEVLKVVSERNLELRQCYARSLRRGAGLRGDLLVALMLDRYGAVLLVQALENTLADKAQPSSSTSSGATTDLLRCVQNTIYRWRFSAADSDVLDQDELALPLRFVSP